MPPTPSAKPLTSYQALALQTTCHAVNGCIDRNAARAKMMANIERVERQIKASKAFIGADLKLVVVPEYFLTGYPLGDTIAAWADKACIAPGGAEYERIGQLCRATGVYFSGNAYETDKNFPDLYFQTSFIVDDQGTLILRYRRLVSLYAPTPHDVWDRYLALYGHAGVFPVVDTPLGRLACVASEEILYPEIARTLALRGAEVILHSSSEVASPRLTPKDIAKRARAYENAAYVISANTATIRDVDMPSGSTDGLSKIVNHHGDVLAEAAAGESMAANALVDLAALRHYRHKPGMGNMLSRQRLELFTETYAGSVYPPNTMLDAGGALRIPPRSHFGATQAATIDQLQSKGIIHE